MSTFPHAKQKPHYEILDGLRGVAAIAIVVFHFFEFIWLDYSQNPLGHGFLAVDFFFCLSGFVTGYAYDDRIRQMGLKNFFRARLIRLHPMVVLGSVLGLIGYLLDPFGGNPLAAGTGAIALTFLCSLLLVPMPLLPGRGGGLFPLNTPSWSLFMEYLANIVYALLLYRLNRLVTLLLAGAAAIWLAFTSWHAGTLIGGWADASFLDGVSRVAFSFLAGLTLFRYKWLPGNRISYAALSILLLLTFMVPYYSWNWAVEFLVVLLCYPLIVALGAGAQVTGRQRSLCLFMGRLSYPLYMSHIPAIWLFGNYYGKYKPGGRELVLIVSIGTLLLIGFGYLVMRLFDEPVRAWLGRRLRKTSLKKNPASKCNSENNAYFRTR